MILFCLWIFYAVNNYFILTNSRYDLGPDAVGHFRFMVNAFRLIRTAELDVSWLKKICGLFLSNEHPFFYLTGTFSLFFGVDKNSLILLNNQIYFAILLFATYGIGKLLLSKEAGVLAAFLISIFPTNFALSRLLMADFALGSMVALSLYMFLANNFKSIKFAISCGIISGLTILTKEIAVLFLLCIFVYSIFLNLKNRKFNDRVFLKNYLIALLICLAFAAPFYLKDFNTKLSVYFHNAYRCQCNPSLFYYFNQMVSSQLNHLLFLFCGLAFIQMLYKKRFFLPLSILFFLVLFSSFSCREERLIFPLYILIAVMISLFVYSLKKFQKAIIIFLILFNMTSYFIYAYYNLMRETNVIIFLEKYVFGFPTPIAHGGMTEEGLYGLTDEGDNLGSARQLLGYIKDVIDKNRLDRQVRVLEIVRSHNIYTSVEYLIIKDNLPIDLVHCLDNSDILFYCPKEALKGYQSVSDFDFIVVEEEVSYKLLHARYLIEDLRQEMSGFKLLPSIDFTVFPTRNVKCLIFQNKNII